MTPVEGIQLVGDWPKDRTVPRKLAAGIKETSGDDRQRLKSLVEALYAAAKTSQDLDLIQKYF